ncbi:hypothetical protein WA158_005993 [Blastocystis sp. Blastoise]
MSIKAELARNNYEASLNQIKAIRYLLTYFYEYLDTKTAWFIPTITSLLNELIPFCYQIDEEGKREHKNYKKTTLSECVNLIRTWFSNFKKADIPKLVACLPLIVCFYKTQFIQFNPTLITPIVPDANGQFLAVIPQQFKSLVAAFYYYFGRYYIYSNNMVKASIYLTLALDLSIKQNNYKNIRTILFYLIPVNIYIGRRPSPSTLQTYNLHIYDNLLISLKTGNIQLFNNMMNTNQTLFLKKGIFFVVDHLSLYIHLMLFKRVQKLVQSIQISISFLTSLYEHNNIHINTLQLEGIYMSLISQKYLKGYIAHKQLKIVVSKENCVPQIKTQYENSLQEEGEKMMKQKLVYM